MVVMNKITVNLIIERKMTQEEVDYANTFLKDKDSKYATDDLIEVETDVQFPAKWEICSSCNGDGKIVNPSIGAITSSEWENEWSFEDRENYMSGFYDVTCDGCCGAGKILTIDEEKADKKMLELYFKQQKEEAEYLNICRMERLMGA